MMRWSSRRARPAAFTSSRERIVLRLLIVLAPVASFVVAFVEASRFSAWLLALVVVGAIACAVDPDSHLGLAIILVFVWCWLVVVDDVTSPATLVAACGLSVFHAAMAAAAGSPPAATSRPAMRRRWLGRLGIVGGVAAGAYLLDVAFAALDPAGSGIVLLLALAAVAGLALVVRARALPRP
jgi:hypothetical protein